MIRRILIPTDGSEQADPAITYGLELAEMTGAELHALYVVETGASYVIALDLGDESMNEYEQYGKETVEEVVARAAAKDLSAKGAVRRGNIAQEIVDYTEDHDIDHIVVGRQGRGAVEQYLGSTAEKVVRRSDQPVTVVRSE